MTAPIFVKNQAASLTVFLRHSTTGIGATGLTSSDVTCDYRLPGGSAFTSKTLNSGNFTEIGSGWYEVDFTGSAGATAAIGSGANGTVTVTADNAVTGLAGNAYSIRVLLPAGNGLLSATLATTVITVNLAVSGGVGVGVQNTATLIAAAISLLDNFTAVASGTGGSSLSIAEGPTAFTGGTDANFSTVGNTVIRVDGSTVDMSVVTAYVAAEAPTATVPSTPPNTVSVFGWLYDASGDPVEDAGVVARMVSQPTVLASSAAVSSGIVSTTTESTGFFSLDLIVGTAFDIFIPDAGYRRLITVPTTSTNLFDIE